MLHFPFNLTRTFYLTVRNFRTVASFTSSPSSNICLICSLTFDLLVWYISTNWFCVSHKSFIGKTHRHTSNLIVVLIEYYLYFCSFSWSNDWLCLLISPFKNWSSLSIYLSMSSISFSPTFVVLVLLFFGMHIIYLLWLRESNNCNPFVVRRYFCLGWLGLSEYVIST